VIKFILLFLIILPPFIRLEANSITEVVKDPTIRLRCENLQEEKRKKLINKEELIRLAKKNILLRKYAPYDKRKVTERLKTNYQTILTKIKQRNFDIEAMTENLIRKGCPSVNFDYLTEEYVRRFLTKPDISTMRERNLNKRKTDYSQARLLRLEEVRADKNTQNEINEMTNLLEDKKNINIIVKNHFGIGVFNYGQSFLEEVEGLDSLNNVRTVSLGFSAYYLRETSLFGRPVFWTTYLAFANESELEVTDDTGTTQAFNAHTNLIGSLSLRTLLYKNKIGVFMFALTDQLTTLYNSDVNATSIAAAVDTRNYAFGWLGAGLDANFSLFKRVIVVSGYLGASLFSTSDVAATATDEFESTSGFRIGLDVSARLFGNFWGDLKYQEDLYSGLSSLSISRFTLGMTYSFF
jgi:hypothetical protein